MDRRDGGDPQAPPRPPKLLPRVHRPRAPEPDDMINETTRRRRSQEELRTATTNEPEPKTEFHRIIRMIGNIDVSSPESDDLPESSTSSKKQQEREQQTKSLQNYSSPTTTTTTTHNNYRHQHQQQQQLNSITTSTVSASTASVVPEDFLVHGNTNFRSNNSRSRSQTHNPNSSNISSNGTFIINTSQEDSFLGTHPDYDNYQIHHLTYLPQRPSSLSRNSSHVSTSSSSSITAANSFTRRRLPPTPGALVPLLTITGSNGAISSGSFFSHFHNADIAATPVTLAQPRPECQRHSNEYVDTPLRSAHQLQHATRNQHPAGQQDNGPTTTHHVLLLPQRGLRSMQQQHQPQQHQQQPTQQTITNASVNSNNHQIHSTRAGAGTAGSATVTATATSTGTGTGTDRIDGFKHSQLQKSTSKPSSPVEDKPHTLEQLQTASAITSTAPHQHEHHHQLRQHLQLPITKQPATSNCKPGQIDLHDIQNGAQQQHQAEIATNNNNSTGIPIISTGHISPDSITCPHCGMCRCQQCQNPRLLPQRWLCNKTCLCSAETVIDYASCLCCAKAFFYHCARDSDMDYDDGTGISYLENPCSCGPYKRAERLGYLSALSLLLPCLWCYWPMRGCTKLGQLCYGYVAGRGCRCAQPNSPVHMLSVMPRSSNGGTPNNNRPNNATNDETHIDATKSDDNTDAKNHHHYHVHHHHHHDDSKASQALCEPEKRLLNPREEF